MRREREKDEKKKPKPAKNYSRPMNSCSKTATKFTVLSRLVGT